MTTTTNHLETLANEHERKRLCGEVAERYRELATLVRHCEAQEAMVRDLEKKLAGAQVRMRQIQAEVEERDLALSDMKRERDDLAHNYAAVQASFFWKLTRPVRAAIDLGRNR